MGIPRIEFPLLSVTFVMGVYTTGHISARHVTVKYRSSDAIRTRSISAILSASKGCRIEVLNDFTPKSRGGRHDIPSL